MKHDLHKKKQKKMCPCRINTPTAHLLKGRQYTLGSFHGPLVKGFFHVAWPKSFTILFSSLFSSRCSLFMFIRSWIFGNHARVLVMTQWHHVSLNKFNVSKVGGLMWSHFLMDTYIWVIYGMACSWEWPPKDTCHNWVWIMCFKHRHHSKLNI